MHVTVVDSGLLIALFDGSDRYHQTAKDWLRHNEMPLCSNIAVVTEAIHLLDFHPLVARDCLSWLGKAIQLDGKAALDWPRIAEVFAKYSDLPADFCDASLVALAERLGTRMIATFDSDFEVYRYRDRERFELVLAY